MKDVTKYKWHHYRANYLTITRLTVKRWSYIVNKQVKGFEESLVFMKDLIHGVPLVGTLIFTSLFNASDRRLQSSMALNDDYFKIFYCILFFAGNVLGRVTYKWLSCVQGEHFFSVGCRKYNTVSCYTQAINLKYSQILTSFYFLKYNWFYSVDKLFSWRETWYSYSPHCLYYSFSRLTFTGRNSEISLSIPSNT